MDVAAPSTGVDRVKDAIGERVQKLFQDFLEDFKEDGVVKYKEEADNLTKMERNTMFVSFLDIVSYNSNLANLIAEEYYRAYPYLCRGMRNYVRNVTSMGADELKNRYLALKDYEVRTKIREMDTKKIGTLVRISGQVVRTHPVHPELVLGTFKCQDCQNVIKDVEQQFKYTQPTICPNPICANRTRFSLETESSRFVDFQKVRIQEVQAELPRGSIPRSVEVILRGEAVETAQAGDRCDFTGTMIVVPDVAVLTMPGTRITNAPRQKGEGVENEGVKGLKALGVREMHYRTAFLAGYVEPTAPKFGGLRLDSEKVTPEFLQKHLSREDWAKIHAMSTDKNLYQNMIKSLFPTIHGNDEIKRGILLMLFGGLAKTTMEGTKLRGDINILIVGDPSCAKSQMLKQVAEFSPRAIYTSGKASTAAGLTAAVVKDEESFESVIEAGALMLADNGVCCIDEFDKMDLKDQVAIHEAMEQQTISIAKAGVRATLNARTSILAAANPIGGRYDRSKSLRLNVNLTPPILSRFDLFFVIIDDCNELTDYAIARSIVNLHSSRGQDGTNRVYTAEEIRQYIMFARLFKPKMTKEAAQFLVEQYKSLRQRDSGSQRSAWRITVRQLESMVRLSEAMARMQCSTVIEPRHVKEAYRLLNKSIIRVEQPDVDFEDEDLEEEDENDENRAPNAEDAMEVDAVNEEREKEAHKLKLKLPFQEYQQISNLMILHMRQIEEQAEREAGEGPESGVEGAVRRSSLIKWYIEEVVHDEIESMEELKQKELLIGKVIDRLTFKDHILIPLTQRKAGGPEDDEDDRLLVVHPNYVLEPSMV